MDRLSTTEVVATDNTQTEISKRSRENRHVINVPHAHKVFHCQLPADGSQPCLDSLRRIDVLHTYLSHPEKSTTFRVDRRLETRGKRERVENVSKVSLFPTENARKWYSSIWSGQLGHTYVSTYTYMYIYIYIYIYIYLLYIHI